MHRLAKLVQLPGPNNENDNWTEFTNYPSWLEWLILYSSSQR